MKKAKVFGNAASILSSMLPGPARTSMLSWLVRSRYKAPGLVFPHVFSNPPKLCVILPEDPLAALHQVSGIMALSAHFKDARITVLCQRQVTPFFRMLTAVQDFIEYDCDQRYLFSKEFFRIGKMIGDGNYDVCALLDPHPHPSLLFLCGRSAAAVRIGFADVAGGYPFLNLQVRPSGKRAYSTDRGLLLASTLGATAQKKVRWTVAKEAISEVNLLLGEMKVDPSSRLIGIDAAYFFRTFDAQWTQSLITMLKDLRPKDLRRTCYLFSYEELDEKSSAWLVRHDLPVFTNLAASRCAALIYKSEFIVAGATVLFELADALHRPVVGIFNDFQFDAYCRESETTRGLRYERRPDQSVIDEVGRHITAFQERFSVGR
jgi:ADP-heptose:LPS heptosyltransferase